MGAIEFVGSARAAAPRRSPAGATTKRRSLVAIYVVSALAIGVLVGSFNLPRYSRLEAHGANVRGTVTATDCGNHQTFAYEFSVGDRVYTGRGGAGYGNPDCAALKPGGPVGVRYLTANPAENLPGDIDARLGKEWISVALAALGLPLVLALVIRRWFARPRGAQS